MNIPATFLSAFYLPFLPFEERDTVCTCCLLQFLIAVQGFPSDPHYLGLGRQTVSPLCIHSFDHETHLHPYSEDFASLVKFKLKTHLRAKTRRHVLLRYEGFSALGFVLVPQK